jgi:hypothetical protein
MYATLMISQRFMQAVMDGSYGIILPAVTSAFEEIYATIIQQWNGNLVHNLSGSSFMLPPAPSSNSEAVGSADQSPCLFIVHLPTSYDQLNDGQNRTGIRQDFFIARRACYRFGLTLVKTCLRSNKIIGFITSFVSC